MSVINQITVGETTYDIQDVTAVPSSRTVNGYALSSNINLDASDVGALPSTYTAPVTSVNTQTGAVTLSASDIGAVPTSRTVNGLSLNANISTVLKFTSGFSVTWTASTPHSSDTGSKFPYRGSITLSGVTAAMHPYVTFGVAHAITGNYSPLCECYAGGVYIWSKNNTTPTIKSIVVVK